MKIHHLTADEALASLHSQREGLAASEAARRLTEYGENRIERLPRPPLWRLLLKEFTHLNWISEMGTRCFIFFRIYFSKFILK